MAKFLSQVGRTVDAFLLVMGKFGSEPWFKLNQNRTEL